MGGNKRAMLELGKNISKLIKENPILPHQEQLKLVEDWQDNNNNKSLDKLIYSNLRFVSREAWKFSNRNKKVSYEDLIQEGVLGLLRAADKFERDRGATFFTYACPWVKAMIMKHVMDSTSIVALGRTREDRRIFGGVTRARIKAESEGLNGDDVDDFICNTLDVSRENLHHMHSALKGGDASLNAKVGTNGGKSELQDLVRDSSLLSEELEKNDLKRIAYNAVKDITKNFPEMEKKILELRLFSSSPITLREVSSELKISHEWVRLTENKVLQKIKRGLAREFKIKSLNDII
jgi:RNA polymerase sigma-32 factor